MEIASGVGYAASLCSVASFVPQVLKVLSTRDTGAISTRMYLLTVAGFALWTWFGLLQEELPIVATKAARFCLSAFILYVKVRFGDKTLPEGSYNGQ